MFANLLGDPNVRKVKKYYPLVSDINILEEDLLPLSDDELRSRTSDLRIRLEKVASLDRFRLSISRSSKNISAQIIDDHKKITLLSASSLEKDIKSGNKVNKTELSKIVAEKLAKKAQDKKITKIFFDRGVYKYHGRIKIFAETLRKNGMEF